VVRLSRIFARTLSKLYEAEDLVQEAWLVAMPRLHSLPARGGRPCQSFCASSLLALGAPRS
jgi:DNA-directed RNA polymerase specialized sigma24 family protein